MANKQIVATAWNKAKQLDLWWQQIVKRTLTDAKYMVATACKKGK